MSQPYNHSQSCDGKVDALNGVTAWRIWEGFSQWWGNGECSWRECAAKVNSGRVGEVLRGQATFSYSRL